jgi:hypothetical protein
MQIRLIELNTMGIVKAVSENRSCTHKQRLNMASRAEHPGSEYGTIAEKNNSDHPE